MRILILNQAFHPDVVSTAQHATDLALELAKLGHQVIVVAIGVTDPPDNIDNLRKTAQTIALSAALVPKGQKPPSPPALGSNTQRRAACPAGRAPALGLRASASVACNTAWRGDRPC